MRMISIKSLYFILIIFLSQAFRVTGFSFTNLSDAYDSLLSNYGRTNIRPLINQSEPLNVNVRFETVSLVKMDEVAQVFVINGFLRLNWIDQFLNWDPSEFDGVEAIYPLPHEIYRPKLILLNTMGVREPFKEEPAPLFVFSNGLVTWIPGSLFAATCYMNMVDFPNDVQTCNLRLLSMNMDYIVMKPEDVPIKFGGFTTNGEWEIQNSNMRVEQGTFGSDAMKDLVIEFTMKRRSAFFLLNLLIPAVLIGFLSVFVFIIPIDSGETIGYSMTVVLSLTVYTSVVCNLIPNTSDTMADLVLFLFGSFLLSVLAVIITVIRTWMYNKDKETTDALTQGSTTDGYRIMLVQPGALNSQVKMLGREQPSGVRIDDALLREVNQFSVSRKGLPECFVDDKKRAQKDESPPRRQEPGTHGSEGSNHSQSVLTMYKRIEQWLDKICFISFFLIYTGLAAYFVLKITT